MKGKRKLLASFLDPLLNLTWSRRLLSWNGLLVINYHRIGDPQQTSLDPGVFSATPESFRAQMKYLTTGATVVSLSDVLSGLYKKASRAVLVTFDDGYRDNYVDAFPILSEWCIPATFFVATGFIDRPELPWWDEIVLLSRNLVPGHHTLKLAGGQMTLESGSDPVTNASRILKQYKHVSAEEGQNLLQQLRSLPSKGAATRQFELAIDLWMTWAMLREMQTKGMEIGGHTVTHPILSHISRDQQEREISECSDRILAETGKRPRAFSYPIGSTKSFDRTTREILLQVGYQIAFSFYGGFNRKGEQWDAFDVRRMAAEADQSSGDFRMMVSLPGL